jgi:hypothetical protein
MEPARRAATIGRVRDPDRIKRYTLVPRAPANGGPGRVKRFSLARVGVTRRSALGVDRHERLEQVADAERHESRNGGDPAKDRDEAQDKRS